jgi:hypothetical protein
MLRKTGWPAQRADLKNIHAARHLETSIGNRNQP